MSIIVAQLGRLFQENAGDPFLFASLLPFADSTQVLLLLQGPSFFAPNVINRDKQSGKRRGLSGGFPGGKQPL
jgi:hypothetical protein